MRARADLDARLHADARKIAADGTFGGSQTYTIRYKGFSERYRVTFRGQFLADGVRGHADGAGCRPETASAAISRAASGTTAWAARAT